MLQKSIWLSLRGCDKMNPIASVWGRLQSEQMDRQIADISMLVAVQHMARDIGMIGGMLLP